MEAEYLNHGPDGLPQPGATQASRHLLQREGRSGGFPPELLYLSEEPVIRDFAAVTEDNQPLWENQFFRFVLRASVTSGAYLDLSEEAVNRLAQEVRSLLVNLQPLPGAPVRLWGEQIRSCATAAVKRRPQLVGCLGVGQLLRVDGAAAADEFQPHPRSPGARLEHRHEVTQRHAERSQHKVRDGAPRDRAVIVCGVAQRVQHTDGEVDGIDVLTVAHGIFCELDIDVQLPELAPVLTVRINCATG